MVKDDTDGDMYIVNTDNELTDIIKKHFINMGVKYQSHSWRKI